MDQIKDFIDQNPSGLERSTLLAWLTEPGRLGELELGATSDLCGAWFGEEGGPIVPDEPYNEQLEKTRQTLAAHHGYVDADDGTIKTLQYEIRMLMPIIDPRSPPASRLDALWADLLRVFTAKLGRPTRRTKETVRFAWDGGEVLVSHHSEALPDNPWIREGIGVCYQGSAPMVRSAAEVSEAAVPVVERPDPEAIKEELNGVLPDCFDCGMTVTKVEVEGEVPPYTVTIGIRFDPYSGTDETDEFTLTVDDPAFDVCASAIESMSEIFGAYT